MYIYIYIHIHTYIHTYMHTCIHAYMHTCIHAYMHTCIHAYMHTCIHTYVHTYTCACAHTLAGSNTHAHRHAHKANVTLVKELEIRCGNSQSTPLRHVSESRYARAVKPKCRTKKTCASPTQCAPACHSCRWDGSSTSRRTKKKSSG